MLADGRSYSTIEATLWCYRDYINRWRRRFVAGRLDGLRSAHKEQKPSVRTPALEGRILAKTQQRPPRSSRPVRRCASFSVKQTIRSPALHQALSSEGRPRCHTPSIRTPESFGPLQRNRHGPAERSA